MKKFILLIAVLFLTIGLRGGIASAIPFEDIYTVDSNGSTTPKNVYSLSETPWLFLEIPGQGFNFKGAKWFDPSFDLRSINAMVSFSSQNWFTPFNWNSIKEPGVWTVVAGYIDPFPALTRGIGVAKFTVTPEPVSSGLFLLGAAALAAKRFRRKR